MSTLAETSTDPRTARRRANGARRAQAHYERTKLLRRDLDRLREALENACDAGRTKLMNHLPDDPSLWIPIVIERLQGKRIVVCNAVWKPKTTAEREAAREAARRRRKAAGRG